MALILLAGSAFAGGSYQGYDVADGRYQSVWTNDGFNAAKQDTVYLLGGPALGTGKYQNDINPSLPDMEGWYGVDLTTKTDSKWHIDTFNAANLDPLVVPNHAAWAGETFADDCGTGEPEGYGNNYKEYLDWYGTVPNPGLDTSVTVNFMLNFDNEPGYDFLYLQHSTQAGMFSDATYNGTGVGQSESVTFNVAAADYVANQIQLRFSAESDGAWSDGDCLWPTSGHTQIDNVEVLFGAVQQSYDDFEAGMGSWEVAFPPSVGEFAQAWPLLDDLDPCIDNETPQVAFIDDGIIMPCTGGTVGGLWNYGPDGFVTNPDGGCSSEAGAGLNNEVWSPVLSWPAGDYVAANFQFGVYRHMPIDPSIGSDGTFYVWHVRSSDDGGMTWTGWADRNFIYYGGPDYIRVGNVVTDLLLPGATDVQLAYGVYQYVPYKFGSEATPAPYLDNVQFYVSSFEGPAMSFRDLEMANDNFPTIGTIDYVNLGNNDIRFDMADDILNSTSPNVIHGDSITLNIEPVRPGSALVGRPQMHFKMKANPVFDAFRTVAPVGGYVEGDVLADTVFTTAGVMVPGKWAFDLDDQDFFYPGDVIHYYIYATDRIGTDPLTDATTTLPADLSGFGVFPGEAGYISFEWPSTFIVRGLPTIQNAAGDQPAILFWNDFANRGGENEWVGSLNALGYREGIEYDVYYTNAPSSGVGNGLGVNATVSMLSGYDTMLYTCGDLASYTITGPAYTNTSGTPNQGDKGNDLFVVDGFLQLGKNFFATGDNLVSGLLAEATGAGATFVSNWFAVNYDDNDIRPLIGAQPAPSVAPIALGAGMLQLATPFVAYGSCPNFHEFDAIQVDGSATSHRAAEFLSANGTAGVYPYAAIVNNDLFTGGNPIGSKIVMSIVDFDTWYTPYASSKALAPMPARTSALNEILVYFGHIGGGPSTPAPEASVFAASNYPNPFNPTTTIKWTIPRAGDLSIKVFNLRGELVKTLVQGTVTETSGTELWSGKDDSGKDVASGVYFYEVRSGSHVQVNKMALVK